MGEHQLSNQLYAVCSIVQSIGGGNLVQTLPSGVATWPTIGIGMGNKILDNIYNMLCHAKNQICSFQIVGLEGG